MGELHLEVTLDRMRTEFNVEGIMGQPQVAYREDLHARRSTSSTSTRSRPAVRASSPKCGSPSSRSERGKGFEFVDETVGGSVPREYVPAVEKGLKMQKEDGVLAHFPTVDFRATPDGRQLPRRRLERADVRNRGEGLLPRSHPQGRHRSCWSR